LALISEISYLLNLREKSGEKGRIRDPGIAATRLPVRLDIRRCGCEHCVSAQRHCVDFRPLGSSVCHVVWRACL